MNSVIARDAAALVDAFRADLRAGQPWFDALLDAIAGWDIPHETIDGREYCYLVGGEAFDWLLLAERLCDAVRAEGLIPAHEADALLLQERPPVRLDEDRFRTRLGPVKYRAHLNFLYGIRVEEALQLAVELQIQKERGGVVLTHDRAGDGDHEAFGRIYGASRLALLREFRDEGGHPMVDRTTLSELTTFTYWLFKRRLARQDPARLASDTRLGLLTLQRLEAISRRRTGFPVEPVTPVSVIESVAVRVG